MVRSLKTASSIEIVFELESTPVDRNTLELKFIRGKGETGKDHFVVNLYGRYCRVRILQTSADSTKTKLYLCAKA